MDISMDIHEKSVDMDMDMDVIFHIHGNPDTRRGNLAAHNARKPSAAGAPPCTSLGELTALRQT